MVIFCQRQTTIDQNYCSPLNYLVAAAQCVDLHLFPFAGRQIQLSTFPMIFCFYIVISFMSIDITWLVLSGNLNFQSLNPDSLSDYYWHQWIKSIQSILHIVLLTESPHQPCQDRHSIERNTSQQSQATMFNNNQYPRYIITTNIVKTLFK